MTDSMTDSQQIVQGIDPRSGEPVGGGVPQTSAAELEAVLDAARAAAPEFGASPPGARIGLLRALADALDGEAAGLAELAGRESGLPQARLTGEVARTTAQLRLFAEVIAEGSYLEAAADSADPDAVPPRPELRRWLEPAGPVLVFAASNFPFAFSVLGGDTASALASGCPVVVKAHPSHPALSAAVAALAGRTVRRPGPAGGRARGNLRRPAGGGRAARPADRRGRVHRVHGRRPVPVRRGGEPARADPVLRRAGQHQPGRGHPGGGRGARGADRGRVRRVDDPGHRPVLHQAGAAVPARPATGWRASWPGRSRRCRPRRC